MSTQASPPPGLVRPRDIRSVLPAGGRLPRVGKLRLGVKKQSTKNDKLVEYPSAVDYFVVNEDASTSRQAAESFHEVYGDEPRELRVTFPAPLLEDVLEGAWRSYGTGGRLKRRCSGPGGECVERGEDGEWIHGDCACTREGLDPEDKRHHCQERFTLTLMLMDVRGVGVWQVDTGSRMAVEGLASSLRMIESFRGHLQGAEATLRVVPRQVAPKGISKTVYILELGSADLTPAQALEMGNAPLTQRVELPPSTLDDAPDDLLDAEVVADFDPATEPPPPVVLPPGALQPDDAVGSSVSTTVQIKSLEPMEAAELYRLAGIAKGSPPQVVRALLCHAWAENGLPDFGDLEPDVRVLLRELLDTEHGLRGGDAA